jgi:tRNA threonylcarbamoyladenosine biosynthesis protein TsaB
LNFGRIPLKVVRSMLSLPQILSQHGTILIVDAASAQIQVGLLGEHRAPVWISSPEEAGVGVFSAVDEALRTAHCSLEEVAALVFCEGPGSVLGIRISATAIRTWQILRIRPVYTYASLTLVAHFQLQTRRGSSFGIVADARRESWHLVSVTGSGQIDGLRRVTAPELNGTLLMPAHFRHWAALPAQIETVPYSLADMFTHLPDKALFRSVEEPDAFLHETPLYQTWTPRIHRAPS